jgi:hypothetical protein
VTLAKAFHSIGPKKNRAERAILDRPGAMPVQDYKTVAVVTRRSAFFAGKPIPFSECVTFVTDPPLRFPLVLLGSPFAIPSSECSRFKSKNKFWPDIVQ